MALIITAQGTAKLIISGTTTELTSIYSRIEFACPKNGESMPGALYNYSAKADYTGDMESILKIKDLATNYSVDIDVAGGQEQSLQIGHENIKAQLETEGYGVTIVDLP